MSKQPKPVRAWAVYGKLGTLFGVFARHQDAVSFHSPKYERIIPGTFTPDQPKRAKKKARSSRGK